MRTKEIKKVERIIKKIAREAGEPSREVRKSMQEALDAAWENAWQPGNLAAQAEWQMRFPGGLKPTLEEFILVISREVRNKTN